MRNRAFFALQLAFYLVAVAAAVPLALALFLLLGRACTYALFLSTSLPHTLVHTFVHIVCVRFAFALACLWLPAHLPSSLPVTLSLTLPLSLFLLPSSHVYLPKRRLLFVYTFSVYVSSFCAGVNFIYFLLHQLDFYAHFCSRFPAHCNCSQLWPVSSPFASTASLALLACYAI